MRASGDPAWRASGLSVTAAETPYGAEKGSEMATVTARPAALDPEQRFVLTEDDRAALLRFMHLMRFSEERSIALYRQGKVPGSFYDGRGQEAVSVGSSFALSPEDRTCVLHRDLGAHFVRGLRPGQYLANYMGRT